MGKLRQLLDTEWFELTSPFQSKKLILSVFIILVRGKSLRIVSKTRILLEDKLFVSYIIYNYMTILLCILKFINSYSNTVNIYYMVTVLELTN